jgi:L-asparaginase
VPGSDPRVAYGDLVARGVHGIVLEAFGVGNMPDGASAGWLPWLKRQTHQGLYVYLASQCLQGPLQPELYKSGIAALAMGVEAGPQMTSECAVVKMMQCLKYRDIPLGVPLAGEM